MRSLPNNTGSASALTARLAFDNPTPPENMMTAREAARSLQRN